MKKVFAGFICIVLLSLCMSTGLAVKAQYDNTVAFLSMMDDMNINYTVEGITDTESEIEKVIIKNKGDKATYTISYFFDKENTEVGIRVWDLISFKATDMSRVLRIINSLNYDYKYVRWYVDETDNTVTVAYDVIVRSNADVADVIVEATFHLVNCIDAGYELLEMYNR